MDARDPVTAIARQVAERVSFFKGRVHEKRRQLRRRDPEVATISALRGAYVCFVQGIGGVRFGVRPVVVAKDRVPVLTEQAVGWFGEVVRVIGPAMEDRDQTVAAAPAVLAAIGAVGHELTTIEDAADRTERQTEVIDSLRSVVWKRGPIWEGIGGKISPKGRLTIGGSKETAYAVYGALADSSAATYRQVRPSA